MDSKIMELLNSNFDIYHGQFSSITPELEKFKDTIISELNNDKYNPPIYFEIYDYLEEVFQITPCLEVFYFIVENYKNISFNKLDNDGNTILHKVGESLKNTHKKEKHEIAKFLIENGCDKTIKNNNNKTAIDIAKENYKNFNEEKHWKIDSDSYLEY